MPKDWLSAVPDLTGDTWNIFIRDNHIVGVSVQNPLNKAQSYVFNIENNLVEEICLRNEKGDFQKLGQVAPETRKARHLLGDIVESEGYQVQIERATHGPYKNTGFTGAIAAGNPVLGKAVLEMLNMRKPGAETRPLTRDEALNLAAWFHKIGSPDEAKKKINAQKLNVKRLDLPFKKNLLRGIPRMPPMPLPQPAASRLNH